MNENNLPTVIDFTDPKMIDTLKQTVAKGATDQEFVMFIELCKASGLNPFKNEVWFIKANGRVMLMTGINGFLAVANSYPEFDGLEVEADNDAAPTKATCKVWRKDRKFPSVGVAMMKEFNRPNAPIWKEKPRVMLTKVAKAIALREAFPQRLNNVYEESEIDADAYDQNGGVIRPKREAKTYRYNLQATKKFIEPGQEAAIKARLKKDYGASFDKESGELVTKKPINGWEEALSINIKAHESAQEAFGDDDLPGDVDLETGVIDDEAESHFAGLAVEVPKNVLSKKDAKAVVEKMKKSGKVEPYVYEDKDINI